MTDFKDFGATLIIYNIIRDQSTRCFKFKCDIYVYYNHKIYKRQMSLVATVFCTWYTILMILTFT